jgi:hypothetical protein
MIQPEEGKRYVTKSGAVTSRLRKDKNLFAGTIHGSIYTWYADGYNTKSDRDSLEEEYQAIHIEPLPLPEKAATDKVGTGLILIPFYSILRIGGIFIEGLRYGKDNWKKGVNDKEYQEERLEHAMLHLIKWKEGDRTEDHLAKVAWFCVTQMELERLEKGTES